MASLAFQNPLHLAGSEISTANLRLIPHHAQRTEMVRDPVLLLLKSPEI
jgi:hypothetical protein